MNGGPIEVCPVCEYDLHTLPRNYRCPECGFEYEETMRVWIIRFPRFLLFVHLSTLALLVVMVLTVFRTSSTVFQTFMIAATVGTAIPALLSILTRRRYCGFLIVGRSGLTYKFGQAHVQFRPWEDVRLRDSVWFADIFTGSPGLPGYLGGAHFLKSSERCRLRDEIVKRLREHASAANQAETNPSGR